MDLSRRLVANSFFNFLIFAVELLLALVLVPFIVGRLGGEVYGVWALISSLLAYSTLLMLGLNSSVNRWVPVRLVSHDFDGINRVVSTVFVAYAVAALGLLVALVGLTQVFTDWFNIPLALESESRWALVCVGLGFVSFIQLSVFAGVLSGLERYDLWALGEVVGGIAQIFGVLYVLSAGWGLVALAAVFGLAQLLKGLLSLVFAFRAFPQLRVRLGLARYELFREMLGYSVNTLLYASQVIIQRQMSLIMIGAVLTTAEVTEYAMPLIAVGVLSRMVAAVTGVLKPAVSRLDANEEPDQVRSVYLGSSKLTLMVSIPVGAVLAIHGDRLLGVWLGDIATPEMASILRVLACSTVFAAWCGPAFFVVVGLGRHRLFGRVAIGKALVSTLIGFTGLRLLGWGTYEVALAFAIPEIVVATLVLIPYCTRCVGLAMPATLRSSVAPALVANAPFFAALALAHSTLREVDAAAFLGLLAGIGLFVPAGAWLFGLSPDEKQALLRALRMTRGGS